MPITPDTKDWTWVLERECPECGFDASTCERSDVARLARENARRWRDVLGQHRAPRTAPDDATWSPLEYACHVRDVYRLYAWRIERMQEHDGVQYENWDQDATAIADRYNDQDPRTVSSELVDAADALADRLDSLEEGEWERRGYRSDGAAFTIDTISRYMIHDPLHHLHDVTGRPYDPGS